MNTTRRKRLLIVTNRFLPQVGGAEYYIRSVAEGLGEHFEVDLATPVRDAVARFEKTPEYRIYRLYNWYNPSNCFPYLGGNTLCPSLAWRMLSGRYDVVHCFPALNYNNFLALTMGKLMRVPVFLTCFDAFDYLGLFASGKFTPETLSRLALSEKRKAWLARFAAILTIAERETEMLKTANPNTYLSPVPVNLTEFEKPVPGREFREAFGIPEDRKLVLCLSRVSYIKGQDILLRAVPLLKQRMPKCTVAFVGGYEHEPAYYEEMQQFAAEYGIEKEAIFTGGVERRLVLSALNACDVHVLPMRFMNAGTINSETWTVGKPILQSSRVDPNYIAEGVDGMTFDIEDTPGLVDKLVHLLENPDLCARMGRAGNEKVRERFSVQALVTQYLEIYQRHDG